MSKVITALGRDWLWPDADEKCHKVVFDWSADLRAVYPHCRAFNCAVQAGGNMGVWPWLLAQKFKRVVTFEPDPVCFPLLVQNVEGAPNIEAYQAALLDRPTRCAMENDDPVNLGAQYVRAGAGEIPAGTIDDLHLSACDLIYLDIEGAELPALVGAVKTIEEFRPVIVVEDKKLSERFGYAKGDIEAWLRKDFGYEVVARPHRDVVMVCK